jgi:hypothetical protein
MRLTYMRLPFGVCSGTLVEPLRFEFATLARGPSPSFSSFQFVGYSDSSYGDNLDCKYTSGYLFKLGGGPVSWKSQKQSITATSSTEAEYVASSIAVKETIWLRKILFDLQFSFPNVEWVLLYGDNTPALDLTTNPAHHSHTKHISVPYHYVREQVDLGTIQIKYLPTRLMPADGLTKPLTGVAFSCFFELLGLCSLPPSGDGPQLGGMLEPGCTLLSESKDSSRFAQEED